MVAQRIKKKRYSRRKAWTIR